jgi:hypothetical protein
MALKAFHAGAHQPAAVMLQLLEQPSTAAALASAVIGLCKVWPDHETCSGKAAAATESAASSSSSSARFADVPELEEAGKQQAGNGEPSSCPCRDCAQLMHDKMSLVLVPVASSMAAAQLLLNKNTGSRGSSSSSHAQQAASIRLLALAVARSFVMVHGRMLAAAAAGGTTVHDMLDAASMHFKLSVRDAQRVVDATADLQAAEEQQANTCVNRLPLSKQLSVWRRHQDGFLWLACYLCTVIKSAVEQQQPSAAAVAWPHLLQLHAMPQLVSAVKKLRQSYLQADDRLIKSETFSSSCCTQQQLLQEVLTFCKVATVAVPLPEVCNNPSCRRCDGMSEAAAAVKACGACGTRYCCRECQEEDWKQHKAACRRLRNSN